MIVYAQIVLGLPVDGPFDYSIPDELVPFAKVGCRARINFRNKNEVGYIVAINNKTELKVVKPLIDVIDRGGPLLDSRFIELASRVGGYYDCSLGEAIETALPLALRRGSAFALSPTPVTAANTRESKTCLIHDLDGISRLRVFKERIAACLQQGTSAILLVPDKDAVAIMQKEMESSFPGKISILLREGTQEIKQWLAIRASSATLVIGTRSAIFAPARDLGLIIVDEEHDYSYKQDQAPHYHAREASIMRAQIEGADLVLASSAPSLEMMRLAVDKLIDYVILPRTRPFPRVKIVDMKKLPVVSIRQKISLSGYLQDAILACLSAKGKALLFLNRKGFATLAICSRCGHIFKCPRCSVNLNFHYDQKLLRCHYCNYKLEPPNLCPECNAGYVRFLGAGTEKLESELARVFPQARIKRWESGSTAGYDDADIFVATQAALRHAQRSFSLVGVLGIDNSLNHVDFRSAEKAYCSLSNLACIAEKDLVIQTNMTRHHALESVLKNDPELFYNEEFRQRKQLMFPPYRHFGYIKVRGKAEDKVSAAAQKLFDALSAATKPAGVSVIAANPARQPRLRGNFYWVILVASKDVLRMNKFLRNNLKTVRYSGIIITVDIDPI